MGRLTGHAAWTIPTSAVSLLIEYESPKALKNKVRGYQPIWRIRSRMSPL